MMETYRVRHAIRDVGAALGMPGGEIDTIAKAFPHIRARDAHGGVAELPELRASGLGEQRLALLFDLVTRLDGLPRHIALHPCGVLLSDTTLLDRTPVEASHAGFPMSQFDKEDVETSACSSSTCWASGCSRRWRTPCRRSSGWRRPRRHRRPVPGAARRPGDLRADRPGQDAGLLPDRVAGPA
jgi:hypothetical protein